MTNSEFSDSFDTLLNSYNSQAQFGEQAGKGEIVLDEYEKSVLLTQAQDIVVKSFFDRRHNSQGDGFDDSTRRQVDFSSLITTATLSPSDDQSSAFDDRGIIYKMPLRKYPTEETVPSTTTFQAASTESIVSASNYSLLPEYGIKIPDTFIKRLGDNYSISATSSFSYYAISGLLDNNTLGGVASGSSLKNLIDLARIDPNTFKNWVIFTSNTPMSGSDPGSGGLSSTDSISFIADANSTVWQEKEGTTDVLFILNEQLKCSLYDLTKNYVIVPINYKEYDREMSKAYAQPLKKQAWRLFQNSSQGFDIQSELIPRWNLRDNETISGYKIRYIRRPCPIVLVDLPNGLEIDGFTKAQECELNPILHPEILQKALELAITTRGGGTAVRQSGERQQ